ncbi:MAG: hypothetical protein K6U80_02205 [Firmicutes bacterium]|nr:hypothetical protein [Bacillota bacterium]
MSDTQIAKIIMAVNSLGTARGILENAIRDEGVYTAKLGQITQKIKECEEELRAIQYSK